MSKRPKLLFLARPFPPLRATACVRTWNIAKYLARSGWDVTVVTPHPSTWQEIDDPKETDADIKQEGINRILTDHQWRILLPQSLNCWNRGLGWFAGGVCRKTARWLEIDNGVGWVKAAERACSSLNADDVDVILATGSPFAAFRLAKCLSDRLRRPYVLDYRDPWTAGNPHTDYMARGNVAQEETKLLANCTGVTIVSPSWGSAMVERFGFGAKLYVIPNGYDSEELASVKPYEFGHFAIVYTGAFYPPKRIISPLMAALKRLKETIKGSNAQWYFHYYGGQDNHVREEARRFGVTERVVLHGRVPRKETLSAVRGAGLAVVITSVATDASIEDKGIVTGKIFEALGLSTPILIVAPRGSDLESIIETTGLARIFTGGDIDGMVLFLIDAICGQPLGPRNPEFYTWANIAQKMDSVLRTAMARSPQKERASYAT